MARITAPEEWQQYREHNYEIRKRPEDKIYLTFLNTITDSEGKLHRTGKPILINDEKTGDLIKINYRDVPERVIQICRVLDPMENKEYIVYDVEQWGEMEEGEIISPVHIQDIGIYFQFNWVRKANPMGIYTGTPQKRTFKWDYEGYTEKYTQEWDIKFLKTLKEKCTPVTQLYVYNSKISGRGGKGGKFGVDHWDDFINRPFQELFKGTYIYENQLKQEIASAQLKQQALDMERKSIQLNSSKKEQ